MNIRIQLTLARRYLAGRKLRTFLTTLAIMFAALVIFSMNLILPTMLQSFQSGVLGVSGQVDLTVTHKGNETFGTNVLRQVRAVPGVEVAAGSLVRTINIPDGFALGGADAVMQGAPITTVSAVGVDPHAVLQVRQYTLQQGRFLRDEDSRAVVISASLAQSTGLALGDMLRLPTAEGTAKLKVVGILPARTLPGNEEVLLPLAEAQGLLDSPDRINTIEAKLQTVDAAARESIQDQVAAVLGDDYQLGGLSSNSEIFASLKTSQMAFDMFGFLALFMGGFIIFNTFRTTVAERRHDIGMLRAIGAGRGTVIGMILAEGLLQGVTGTVAGMVLGYLCAAWMLLAMRPLMQQYIHMTFGMPVVTPGLILVTAALGIGVTLLAGIIPALSASRVSPLEALRPAVGAGPRRLGRAMAIAGMLLILLAAAGLASGNSGTVALGGLLCLVGLVMVAPAVVRPLAAVCSALLGLVFARRGTGMLAEGNVTRQPGRAAVTASATMIGLAIIVAAAGTVSSLSGFYMSVLEKSMGSDYLLIPPSVGVWASNVGASTALAERLRGTYGIAVVSSLRYAPAQVNGKSISLLGIDPVTYPKVSGLNFEQGNSAEAYAALGEERNVIINGVMAADRKLKLGDTLEVSTARGLQTYRVVGVAGDYLNAKIATAYTSQANLRDDFHKTEDVFIQMNLAPGVAPEEVEPRLRQILKDYPQFRFISRRAYFSEVEPQVNAVFSVLYLVIAVLAVPAMIALLNTLAIGVIERTREIGMLRAIGATRRQVRVMVVTEALLLAAIGTALGLLAGLYLGYVMVLGANAGGFPVPYAFPLAGLLAATACGLIFGVLAALLPARQAAGLVIIRALRYE